MGKLAVGLVTAALVAWYLRTIEPFASDVTSPLAPAMLCFFIGFFEIFLLCCVCVCVCVCVFDHAYIVV